MINLDEEFDKLLCEYGIIKVLNTDNYKIYVNKWKNKVNKNTRIGLYGAGKEALNLMLNLTKIFPDIKIQKCFDKSTEKFELNNTIMDTTTVPIEMCNEYNLDYMIIGSRRFAKEFKKKLYEQNYKGQIIDLYEYLNGYIEDHYSDHKIVFEAKQKYINSNKDEKAQNLAFLIKQFLLIKDFINFDKYVDIYIEKKYKDYEKYRQLKTEIYYLLNNISSYIKSRRKKDIIINWVDALSYYDLSSFKFLGEQAENGACFENAYSVIPWTSDATRTILSAEYPIDGKTFLISNFDKNNSPLIRTLKSKGYEIAYCGIGRISLIYGNEVISPFGIYDTKYASSTVKQWDALKMICQSTSPICVVIHNLYETHEPFICGENETFIEFGGRKQDWEDERCVKQAKTAGVYMDSQLEFYSNILGDNVSKIYLSDHGRIGNSPMEDEKIHIILLAVGPNIGHKIIHKMFSIVDFDKLVFKVLNCQEIDDELTKDYVIIQNVDAYSKSRVERAIQGKFDMEEVRQCRGIVTHKDSYFRFFSGEEFYYPDKREQKNEINNPKYDTRVNELRKNCGDKFIDIYKYKKFSYSRMLYEKR